MADEQNIVTVTTTDGEEVQVNISEEGQKLANKAVRDYADSMKAENQNLRGDAMGTHLSSIGLDPTTGLGKAIAKEYDGSITADAVAAYASEEYGYAYEVAAPEEQPTEQAQQLASATQQQAQLESVSTPAVPATEADQIAALDEKLATPEATAEDAKAAMNAKLAAYLQATGR